MSIYHELQLREQENNPIKVGVIANPLCGPDGASRVYGPQKGADEKACIEMDEWLRI